MIIVFWPFQCLRLPRFLCRSAPFWSHSFVTGSCRPTNSGAWSCRAVGPLCFKILLFLVNKVSGRIGNKVQHQLAGCLTIILEIWPSECSFLRTEQSALLQQAKLTLQRVAVAALNDLQPGQKGLGEVCSPHTRHRQCWIWTTFLNCLPRGFILSFHGDL